MLLMLSSNFVKFMLDENCKMDIFSFIYLKHNTTIIKRKVMKIRQFTLLGDTTFVSIWLLFLGDNTIPYC